MLNPRDLYPPRPLPPPRRIPTGAIRPSGPQPAGNMPFGAQLVIGFFSFFWILAIGIYVAVATASGAAFGVVMVLGILAAVLFTLLKFRWRGFLVGVLIALGLCLLLAGLCAGMLGAVGYR
jgi:hypothetical protein